MAPLVFSPAVKEKCRKQVEFYFSDSNAHRDKFLMDKIQAHPEGYVELALLAAFARLAQHMGREPGQRPDEVPDNVIAQLAEALKESEMLEVSEDKLYVRRKTPFGSRDEAIEGMDNRSIYACPFPFDSTLEQLQTFFNQYAHVKAIRLRRFLPSKDFKGSIFVEFGEPEAAQKVAKLPDVVHEGAPLRIELKTDYLARKRKEYEEQKAATIKACNGGKSNENFGLNPDGPLQREPKYDPGLLVEFNILGEAEMPTDLHFSVVKNAFGGKDAGIGFVEFPKNTRTGRVRLLNEEAKASLLGRRDPDGCVPVGDLKAVLRVLEGEEEKQFYVRAEQKRIQAEILKRSGGGTFVVEKRKQDFGDRGRGRGRGRGRFGRAGRINNNPNA